MRHVHKQQLTAVALAVALMGASAHAQTTPDSVQTRIGTLNFERGFPTEETKRKVFDEIDYQRAVQAYLWAYPAVSFESIRIAAKAAGMDLNEMVHRRQLSPTPRASGSPRTTPRSTPWRTSILERTDRSSSRSRREPSSD